MTLLELVVVLAILAVATALVVPLAGRGSEQVRLRSEAGRVAALVREARLRAVSRREPVAVTLDRARNTVAMSPAAETEPVRQVVLPPGVRLGVDRGGERLTFSPRGLTRQARWTVEGPSGRKLWILIEGVTGRVSVTAEQAS